MVGFLDSDDPTTNQRDYNADLVAGNRVNTKKSSGQTAKDSLVRTQARFSFFAESLEAPSGGATAQKDDSSAVVFFLDSNTCEWTLKISSSIQAEKANTPTGLGCLVEVLLLLLLDA